MDERRGEVDRTNQGQCSKVGEDNCGPGVRHENQPREVLPGRIRRGCLEEIQMKTKIDRVTLFWIKVERRGEKECWPWTGAIDRNGYGRLRRMGKGIKAHQMAWTLARGPIPKGLVIRHLVTCRTKRCCNPEHLLIGTQAENVQDSVENFEMRQGEQHRSAKLTRDQVIEIRKFYRLGSVSIGLLAELYSVSSTAIFSAIKRRTWKSVP
jgi:hypothetical protein